MREYRTATGRRQVFYEPAEIDNIMSDELTKAGLMPDASVEDVAVDVERFVEGHLGVALDQHADLEDDVLGITRFVPGAAPRIEINRSLTGSALDSDDTTPGMIGRWRATVAHEAGHVLLHRNLFELDDMQRQLFAADGACQSSKLMRCLKRDVAYAGGGDPLEIQANMAIGALLMPRSTAQEVVVAEMGRHRLGRQPVQAGSLNHERLVSAVARRFTVSKAVARIRMERLRCVAKKDQPLL